MASVCFYAYIDLFNAGCGGKASGLFNAIQFLVLSIVYYLNCCSHFISYVNEEPNLLWFQTGFPIMPAHLLVGAAGLLLPLQLKGSCVLVTSLFLLLCDGFSGCGPPTSLQLCSSDSRQILIAAF